MYQTDEDNMKEDQDWQVEPLVLKEAVTVQRGGEDFLKIPMNWLK
jgi:hypothetical protein